ncbi:MAG: gamma-glutamyltransferase, partial [Bacteroidota bacterium]
MFRYLAVFGLIFLIASCKNNSFEIPQSYAPTKKMSTKKGMVVSAHPIASEVGNLILKKGGNAIDAAVATQFALAVVYPGAGNIGGGGFMIYRPAAGDTTYALDYREKAPKTASRDMYLDSLGKVTDRSRIGHQAAGVPGTVAGLFASHQEFGKLAMSKLIQPAIELAEKGFPITGQEARALNDKAESFRTVNTAPHPFVKDTPWETGDLLIQPELAQTLMRIKENGQVGFYDGETA